MIKLYSSSRECCGCTACVSICPQKAISMSENEYTESIPVIDYSKCIECGLCQKVCDFKKFKPTDNTPDVYAFRIKNKEDLNSSQSGGASWKLVKEVLKKNGVVFGCESISPYDISHKMETNVEDCKKFKGSKYVQSNMRNCFVQCKEQLDKGVTVLFTGTGCQVHGLLRYLKTTKTPMENLYTMDIVCHGAPRQAVWKRYIKLYEEKLNSKIVGINFRDKAPNGWHNHIEKYILSDGKEYHNKQWTNMFYKHLIFRESCYNCSYTTTNRNSDFTVADFWGVEKTLPEIDDNRGVSLMLVHTKKGKELVSEIYDQEEFTRVELKDAIQPQLVHPAEKGKFYNSFWKHYVRNPEQTIKQFFLPSFTTKVVWPFLKGCRLKLRKVKKALKKF